MAKRKLELEIVGDSKSLERAFGKAGKGADNLSKKNRTLGKAMGALGKAAKLGAVAGLAALGATAAIGVKGLLEDEKAIAKVNSALKSTGGAANVSSKEIQKHAGQLQALSGVGADSIMTNQSLLLSFTNIRNEAGKGNDVFNQATETMLDMSLALDQDMKSSAVQLGKALNDPVKGITALSRVGVAFTDQQKAQIEAMVESGDTMGAQKVILAELNKEFGGTAEAIGETTQGKIDRTKRAFEEMAKKLMAFVLPAVAALSTWLTEVGIPWLERFSVTVQDTVSDWMPAIRDAFERARQAAEDAVDWWQANVAPTIEDIVAAARWFWNEFGDDVVRVMEFVVAQIGRYLELVKAIVQTVMAILRGDWSAAWDGIKTIVTNVWASMIAQVEILAQTLLAVVIGLGRDIGRKLLEGLAGLGNQVKDLLHEKLVAPWAGLITAIVENAKKVPGKIMEGIRAAFGALEQTPQGWLVAKLVDVFPGILSSILAKAKGIPGKIMEGIRAAFQALKQSPLGFLTEKLVDVWGGPTGLVQKVVGKAKEMGREAMSGLKTAVTNGAKAPVNALIGVINDLTGASKGRTGISDFLPFVDIPAIPKFARGTITDSPLLGIFGEAGPEALIPLDPSKRRHAIPLLEQAAAAHGMALHGFGLGGIIKGAAGKAVGGIKSFGAGLFGDLAGGASSIIGKLPGIPSVGPNVNGVRLGSAVGREVLEAAKAFIRELVPRALKKLLGMAGDGGIGGAIGNVWKPLLQAGGIVNQLAGGNYTVTSGFRAGSKVPSGRPSFHSYSPSQAIDVAQKSGGFDEITKYTKVFARLFGMGGHIGPVWWEGGGARLGWRVDSDHFDHTHIAAINRGAFESTLGRIVTGKIAAGDLSGLITGTPYVPETGPVLLHRGEAVLNPLEAREYRARGGIGGALFDKLADEVHVHEPADVERITSDLAAKVTTRLAAV